MKHQTWPKSHAGGKYSNRDQFNKVETQSLKKGLDSGKMYS
jgi:hypothetical protein